MNIQEILRCELIKIINIIISSEIYHAVIDQLETHSHRKYSSYRLLLILLWTNMNLKLYWLIINVLLSITFKNNDILFLYIIILFLVA